ncbi:hypothetical protein C9994_02925 [Marivirga lumbricoides]|uniref:histidine kinase n=1 Tax=Marivirga lumbricoides TaxID=1046115 RepID=A0A2T4DUD6_9BACT|nr:hypothetical protein C9994_02925 [Marivirga lumbricoides]
MNKRLKDLNSYGILDTPADKELDEITELASIICDTPISLITILDDKRQWFKSNKGFDVSETEIEASFCQHALHKPGEVLVVNDALKDERFINNKLVLEDPNIRFYAGAPLVAGTNSVLGTLCIIDIKPRELSEDQKRALQILAKKAMDIIETNKTLNMLKASVKLNLERLTKITQNIPLGIFELEVSSSGVIRFVFLSEGMKKIHPSINLEGWLEDPTIGFSIMHPDDITPLKNAIRESIKNHENIYHEYRVRTKSGYEWHSIYGQPEKTVDGDTLIYGAFTNITHHIVYEKALEQIAFDISHVLRSPVTTILGITNLLESEKELSAEKLKEYSGYIKTVSHELEKFTRELNVVYNLKKRKIAYYRRKI